MPIQSRHPRLSAALSVTLLALIAAGTASAAPKAETSATVEFNRDIRPILSDKCYACHGPDKAKRLSNLRLDNEEGAKADLGGRFAIVPGDSNGSHLIKRITADNEVIRMPPVHSGKKLSDEEIGLFKQWVSEGAEWQKHWSFISPKRPARPEVSDPNWPLNPIDSFVLARLDRAGVSASKEASRETLIRRVTLDLTGLPPTPAEVDEFLADTSPDAYEKLVDRLLKSPRYGERIAVRWLDAARYADTNGYQTDAERYMWRWRDWVIEAFNDNMPFDQFTVEQIAGDMLPNATLEQKIASAFNRNHRGNGEGGIIAAEYAVEYVVDRVETTSTVWLGLTMGCTRCHDHKYDPITQKEFYKLFAYFNNVPENGKAFKYGNSPPFIGAPTREQQQQLVKLDKKLARADEAFKALQADLDSAQKDWEKALSESTQVDWLLHDGLIAHYPLDGNLSGTTPGASRDVRPKLRDGLPDFSKGQLGQAAGFDGKRFIEAGDIADFRFYENYTLSAWIYPASPNGTIISRSKAAPTEVKGWGLFLRDGKPQLNMVTRWLDDASRVETAEPIELNQWHHVLASYDGTRLAEGSRIYVDGKPVKRTFIVDELNAPFGVKAPLRIGAGDGDQPLFEGLIDDVRIYDRALRPAEVSVVAAAESLSEIAKIPADDRTQAQSDKLRLAFLDQYSPVKIQEAWQKLVGLRKDRAQLVESFPTVMVMQERENRRDTHLLLRGAYDAPGERVTPGIPAALPPIPEGAPNDRLGFARWLVDSSNPLTARVTVNRFWQTLFGVGLVKTVEDFGSQGEWPVHMDLLDWLAVEFVDSGWDVKGIMKTIVTSATYRQSSKADAGLYDKDPENRLLARGPRYRLSAEVLRDQALSISGLLVEQLGGPSVKPYQPTGLWTELAGGKEYPQDHGDKLYRRGLYTFWKRAVPPPAMLNFDSAGREACTVRETRTNTPLQALNLMNDVTFVESSRMMAERMIAEGGTTPAERVAYGFRLATARQPGERRTAILVDSFHHHLDNYETDRKAALALVTQGEHPRSEELDIAELASYTTVASLILNLDETITKE